jgi:hypothetical protein
MSPLSSKQTINVIVVSEMFVTTYNTKRYHNPEDHDLKHGLTNCGTRTTSGMPSPVQQYMGLVRNKGLKK